MDFSKLKPGDNLFNVNCRVYSFRAQKRITFFVLKDSNLNTLQAIVFGQKIDNIPNESVVSVTGKLVNPGVEIKSDETTVKNVEMHLSEIKCISASEVLPIQVSDLNHNDIVGFSKCLDHRVIDIRSQRNQAIFRLKSYLLQNVCQYLWSQGFIQIQTPKLTAAASEGGAEVFETRYFGNPAYLVQSPQLYKQMCINGDFRRVFEVGPVFRAENSRDSRHLCEFTGVDLEMAFDLHNSYQPVLHILWELLCNSLLGIQENHKELLLLANPSFECVEIPEKPVILSYPRIVSLLRIHEVEFGDFEDLKNEHEQLLGEIVKKEFKSDLVIVDKYPLCLRPFYTMPDPKDSRYSNSYDVLLRGQEIMSGAQRIHDYKLLKERASELGVNLENLSWYLDSFRYGSFPHAGGGFGLERILSRLLNLSNIKSASLFPRAPGRLSP